MAADDFELASPAPWLRIGAELRARGEVESFSIAGQEDTSLANLERIRVSARFDPRSWLRFVVSVQDARTLTGPRATIQSLQDNQADTQHLYAEIGGAEEAPWNLRIGRQPLSFGDERLIGADSFWCNRSQRFDGVRATLRRASWQWDVFSASPVEVVTNRVDPVNRTERLSGIYASWSAESGPSVQPYVFWKRARPEPTAPGEAQRYDLWTPGLRVAVPIALGFEIATEMAIQQGRSASVPVRAWAGFWEVGRRMGRGPTAPRLAWSYSQASGDSGSQRRIGTFNDLNPAGYNGCGFFEPFAWRNIRDLRLGADWTPDRHWRLNAELHGYWLSTIKDGVYVDGGQYVAYNPNASSTRLGTRFLVSAQRSFASHIDVGAGYAKFLPAAYMRSGMSLSHSAFVSWTVRI